MSEDNAVAGMPNTVQPKEILWGRQGLGPNFYGPELMAEAIWEVLKSAELSRLRGFTRFPVAFERHNFSLDWKVAEGEKVATLLHAGHVFNPNISEFCGAGSYDEEVGLVLRTLETSHLLENGFADWMTLDAWTAVTNNNDILRLEDPKRMPDLQVSHLRNTRLFISRANNLVVLRINWMARWFQPTLYLPLVFEPVSVRLVDVYTLDQDGIQSFCVAEGARAGAAFLRGLKLLLQSSNYQVRKELEKNADAVVMAERLLERIEV